MPEATLTVSENLISPNTSNIVIEDGGQLIHPNDDVYATVKKTAKAHDDTGDNWNLLARPLTGLGYVSWGIQNFLSNQYDLYYYDEPTHYWNNYKQTDNNFYYLEAGKGYLYANSGTMETTPNGIQISEGIGTTNTFYTYCNYISECLFRANELATAGLGTEPLGAFCWYATNSYASEQSNISIWMANVSDNELTENSHITNEMTLVYTGNMNPSSGWNEFVFNESSFTWDGTSNVLICVQRNNGEWNWDDVSWQCHGTDFAAMSYDYSYDNAYDMTSQTYYMSTNYYRPNIVFGIAGQLGQSVYYYPTTLFFAGKLANGSSEISVPLSRTEGINLAGLNLVGNPFACNAYLLDENHEALPFFKMNDAGDAIVAAQAGTAIKPCEGVFVICPNDRELHSAIFTTTAPTNLGNTQSIPPVSLPLHDLLVNQDAFLANGTIQTIALSAGWNWFSTNVEITLDDLENALVEALPGTTINIKSQTQNVKYQNGRWTGQLTALDMTQMYMISVENDCEISLEGMPIDPSGLTVTINNGANWIAFPYSESMSVTDFFGSFPVNNDQVKSQSQNARYQGNRWAGQLNTLEPGKGYLYISDTPGSRTFTFPVGAK